MIPQWQTATVIRIEQETHNTRRFWLELSEPFDFKPGQFLTVDLPIHEKRNKRWRSYSIASAPSRSNQIELIIVRAEPSLGGSQFFFDAVKEGSTITVRGPQGVFVLPENLMHDLFLICTGTGIAPFRSMIHYIRSKNIPYQKIYLIFGCRTQADLLYYDEMLDLASSMPGFYYHPTLSREHWNGLTGYVHPVYERLCANSSQPQFLLCGWRQMIDEAKARLMNLGFDKSRIHMELYG